MYYTSPPVRKADFEHIRNARKSAIEYICDISPEVQVFIYERRRGLQGYVYVAYDFKARGKKLYMYESANGVRHVLNKDGSFRK